MWRQKIFPGDEDSDQSISDEEDFNVDLRDNCVSLGGPSEKAEVVQLQSRLDILKGTDGETCGRIAGSLSPKKQVSVFVEDEVEMPEFPDEVGFIFSPRKASTCTSDEEAISANEKANALPEFSRTPFHKDGFHDFGSARLDGENTWSVVSKEAKALVHLNENALCSSSSQPTCKANKSGKGIQSKSKPKFSFRFQPRREGLFSPVSKNDNSIPCKVDELSERMETVDCEKHSITGLLGGFPGKKATQSEMVPDEVEDPHWCDDHSVAEHLDSLRDSSSLLRRNSKMCRIAEQEGKGCKFFQGEVFHNWETELLTVKTLNLWGVDHQVIMRSPSGLKVTKKGGMEEERGQLFSIQEFAVMLTLKLEVQFVFTPPGKRFRWGGMVRALFYLRISPKFQHDQLGFFLEQRSNYSIP
ncbi:uncharacterized protein LOC102615565 isoform X5 [Citrus sinensis]|uniref:uncharacterized protein LOC18051138 isoform X7 n=1 Tax=Citrus clementina TaxID=85681 RepID=UPI000CED3E4E|nr:uncharacterized protein LOC18051138 isoform X7 [Citrus x clementina]XP_024950936.2 uncharacterized protein LOC102615565 isoform X5 [Citrus sinensis]